MSDMQYAAGDLVRSDRYGIGTVRFDAGATVIVRFADGLEECERTSLTPLRTPLQALALDEWERPLDVIVRVQAAAIQSANDSWGVYSRSRIELLPHQLWVCHKVGANWPARWLVADDVGLGKTIEAGLILWPLLSRGRVRRLLILCPASLVEQWQWRMKEMFDIRLTRYLAELDTERSDFWNSQSAVVASLQTLRLDKGGRQARLIESEPWDLIVVDEAHHLNADEQGGPTLGYRLIEQLVAERRVTSLLFFTGTPHRGKEYGFWSLLRLLRPDLFNPKHAPDAQLPLLNQVMIRNNKQNVTDLEGRRLFLKPHVETVTYRYSEAEARFYRMLTDFILSGQAYASGLSDLDGRAVMLVLIAMQKLASSSVAAIRRALMRRLESLRDARASLTKPARRGSARPGTSIAEYDAADMEGDLDRVGQLEEDLATGWTGLKLMGDEEARLQELIAAAAAVEEETKIREILGLLRGRFAGRPVLLFTEYKATQSLLISALRREFGDGCATFINGDDRADDILDSQGRSRTLRESREVAAQHFNDGTVRFLVSTEAGGEGIDLQERCHSLIHVDLPWNPMRMHQRVGRLNRYGQKERVEVVSLHNPDTVESLIWAKLNSKIENIMRAFGEVMEEPEDLLQLVLGMTSPSLFRDLFAGAHRLDREAISHWFDQKTGRFGGKDAVDTVKELIGHAARFDFRQASSRIPRSDLPALQPFFRAMLALNGRQAREDERGLSFKTPDSWLDDPGVRQAYDGMIFERSDRSRDAVQRIIGVGHRAFDQALGQAQRLTASVTALPAGDLAQPLIVFSISDQVTTEETAIRMSIIGVELQTDSPRILQDWELLETLNNLLTARGPRRLRASASPKDRGLVAAEVLRAQAEAEGAISALDLPFKVPSISPLAVLWPGEELSTSSE